MDLGTSNKRWLFHAFLVICAYTFSFSVIKIGAESVHVLLIATMAAAANFICHFINVLRLKIVGASGLVLPMRNIVLGLLIGLCISLNNTSTAFMFDVDAPLSVAMPVLNTGIVLLSVLYGLTFFREKLQIQQVAGIVLAIIGIVLINV
jgi:drug/metabolite transporter (DMT)-like permease